MVPSQKRRGLAEIQQRAVAWKSLAHRLKSGEKAIADYLPEAAILFIDIVGFTDWCHQISPLSMIEQLSGLFTLFDAEIKAHGVEKVKSIGDAYLVASGLPDPRPDFAEALVACALSIQRRLAKINLHRLRPWLLRCGIASGPVIAGVIGNNRFIYDVWGDTVNHASRLERLAKPNEILLCDITYSHVRDRYTFADCGLVELKGMGKQKMWSLRDSPDSLNSTP